MLILAYTLMMVGGLWLAVVAFKESVIWGLACLLVPFASPFFVITRWSQSKTPFLVSVAGAVIFGFTLASTHA